MNALKVALVALLLLPSLGWAEGRIAVLDMEGVIRASKGAEAFREKLREEFAADEAALRQLSDEGNALKAKMEKEGDFLSAGERQELLGQIQKKYEEFQRLGNQVKQSTQQREREFLDGLRPEVEAILKQLVEKENIDVILNRRATIYVNPDLDLSQVVLDQLNKK